MFVSSALLSRLDKHIDLLGFLLSFNFAFAQLSHVGLAVRNARSEAPRWVMMLSKY